jgi:glycosyltransferase involved in cell wall biosynthesis
MQPAGSAIGMEFRATILMPTYNNAGTLPDVVRRAQALHLPNIIVNDGSTDSTSAWLAQRQNVAGGHQFHIVTHRVNRGKGAALQTGFAEALKLGYTHAVTIDTDGQLDPEDIPSLLAAAQSNPQAFVLGYRDDQSADYPARSRLGRRLSNLAIRLECRARVRDSQCGLRVYPLEVLEEAQGRCKAGRFGYEVEIITHAAWSGCQIINLPVRCRYFPGPQRVTHFRPWRDSMHGIRLHAKLLGWRWLPLPGIVRPWSKNKRELRADRQAAA